MGTEQKGKIQKQKIVIAFGIFVLFMLVCTFISRSIYTSRMPQVEVGYKERGTITRSISGSGVIDAAAEIPVLVKDGIRVSTVDVAEGERVNMDQVILTLDVSDLQDKVEEIQNQVVLLEQKQQEDAESETKENQQKEVEIARAKEDLNSVNTDQAALVQQAQSEYDAAVNACNAHPGWEQYLAAAQAADPEYQEKRAAAEAPEADPGCVQEFQNYAATFNAGIQSTWQQEVQTLESTRAEKQAALDAAGRARDTAVREAERALEDAQSGSGTTGSGTTGSGTTGSGTTESGTTGSEGAGTVGSSARTEQELALKEKKEELEQYQTLLDAGGAIKSTIDGTVKRVSIEAGQRTGEDAVMFLGDLTKGFQFTGTIQQEDREDVKVGDSMTLSFKEGRIQQEDVKAERITQQEDGTYQVVGTFENADVDVGMACQMQIDTSEEIYDCCVPLSALFTENGKIFVWKTEEADGFLGPEIIVRKQEVEVAAKNQSVAALKDAPLSEKDQIIVAADRQIKDKDQVRLEEDE